MALNVNWNWRMPTVGDPDKVAAGNRQDFLSGLDSIASGLIKSGENQRADEKQKWLETTNARDYAEKVRQFDAANQLQKDKQLYEQLNANRDYWETKRLNDAKIQDMKDAMGLKQRQQQFNEMAYNKMYGDTPQGQEMAALQQALGTGTQELQALMNDPVIKQYLQQQEEQNNASSILYGLNPQFLNLR